jgi:hypothetical protein
MQSGPLRPQDEIRRVYLLLTTLNAGDMQSLHKPLQLRTHRDSARQTKHGK